MKKNQMLRHRGRRGRAEERERERERERKVIRWWFRGVDKHFRPNPHTLASIKTHSNMAQN
jgi:hypothetical protein